MESLHFLGFVRKALARLLLRNDGLVHLDSQIKSSNPLSFEVSLRPKYSATIALVNGWSGVAKIDNWSSILIPSRNPPSVDRKSVV